MASSVSTIEVDAQAAEILRRVSARAKAKGETLGSYLLHALPSEVIEARPSASQRDAWESFVSGMTAWSKAHLPPGYIADDGRDAAYDDRS